MWFFFGMVLSLLTLYQKTSFSLLLELKKLAKSSYTVILILFLLTIVLFIPSLNNFFTADDFTWFRWATDCKDNCGVLSQILNYFLNSDGFFYRPGSKLYFLFMYKTFWLNQSVYHLVSISLHFLVAVLFFLLSRKVLKNSFYAASAAVLFLLLSGATEVVFWISTTGYLFNTVFGLLGILLFIQWSEKKRLYLLLLSVLSISSSLLFHEVGIVYPLIIVSYALIFGGGSIRQSLRRWDIYTPFIPIIGYLAIRYLSNSHWFSGDYSYDILKFPFNVIGNSFGYFALTIFGPITLPVYHLLRETLRESLIVAAIIIPVVFFITFLVYKYSVKIFDLRQRKILVFGIVFFIFSLLPFLGLGNITSRYSYLASMGAIFIFIILAKKAYEYLISIDRKIAIGISILFILLFLLFHVIQVQQSYFNWNESGTKVKKFFLSIDDLYENTWKSPTVQFHFVDVPIKVGEAWVLPVGLPDALWFAIQNDSAKVFIHSDAASAINASGGYLDRPVLIFQPDGSLKTPFQATASSDLINQALLE